MWAEFFTLLEPCRENSQPIDPAAIASSSTDTILKKKKLASRGSAKCGFVFPIKMRLLDRDTPHRCENDRAEALTFDDDGSHVGRLPFHVEGGDAVLSCVGEAAASKGNVQMW